MLFSIDRSPASRAADITTCQLISSSTCAAPITAIAVWQTVLNALTPAAFQNSLVISITFLYGFSGFSSAVTLSSRDAMFPSIVVIAVSICVIVAWTSVIDVWISVMLSSISVNL